MHMRTTLNLDDALLSKAMSATGVSTKTEVVTLLKNFTSETR